MSDALKTVVLGDKAAQVAVTDAQIIEAFVADQKKVLADAESKIADLQKQVETKDGELKAAAKSLADAQSPAVLADMAKKRAKTVEAGKKAGMSEDDMDKMGDADIKRAVVAKSLGDAEAKAMSDAAIDGAFAYAQKSVTKDADADLANGVKGAAVGDAQTLNDAYTAYYDRIANKSGPNAKKEA